jgi:hypothetical protein
MKYWHTWKILERAVYKVEIITGPTYTGIGMKTWKYRILESLCPTSQC